MIRDIKTIISITGIVFFQLVSIQLMAQPVKRNILQVKHTINYYKGYKPSLIYSLFFPDITYKHFSKNKQRFIEFGTDILSISYRDYKGDGSAIGKIFFRYQYIIESKIGTYLIITPNILVSAKAGLSLRLGDEARYVGFNLVGGFIPEYIVETHNYNDIGFNSSLELSHQFSKRWSLNLETGGRYLFTRQITSKSQWWASLGIGYAF